MILLRYFFREVLLSTTAVSLVLLLVMLSTRFVKYLANAAAGNLDTNVVFLLILYRIPDFLQLILPLGLFVALLLVYGRMYLDNEMRVLFAAGISRWYLFILTMAPVLLVTAIVALISLWISPRALARVETIYHQQDSRSELESLKAGQFQPFRNNRGVIYAEKLRDGKADGLTASLPQTQASPQASLQVLPQMIPQAPPQVAETQMENVYIFQQEETRSDGGAERGDVILAAKTGKQITDEHGRYLVLQEGYRLKEIKAENRFEKIEFARYGQRIENNNQSDSANLQTDALPTQVLMQSDRRDYQVAWQWRLSIVLLVPIVALIAVALGKSDPRQGRYFKILPAILLYLLYLILLNVARDQLIGGRMPLALGIWWVHGLFLLLGYLLFNLESWMPVFLSWRAHKHNRYTKDQSSGVAL